jgi:hypothetical protein
VKFRTNLLKIRRIIDCLIENGVDERVFESKRMELLKNCYKEMEYMKIKSLGKKCPLNLVPKVPSSLEIENITNITFFIYGIS